MEQWVRPGRRRADRCEGCQVDDCTRCLAVAGDAANWMSQAGAIQTAAGQIAE